MATVDVEKLARALNLTRSRIAQLVHEGMPKEARGQYDFFKCAAWYVRWLQRAIEKRDGLASGVGYVTEGEVRTRLLRVQADLAELELAKQLGQLVDLYDFERRLTDLVLTTKARITAVPARIAPELVGETSRVMIQAKLERAYVEALAYLDKATGSGQRPAEIASDIASRNRPAASGKGSGAKHQSEQGGRKHQAESAAEDPPSGSS